MVHPNTYINSILWGGNTLDSNTISYSFWSEATLDDAFEDIDQSDTPWFEYEIAAMQQALELWSNVANIDFVQVNDDDANADFKFVLVDSAEFPALGQFSPPDTFAEGTGYFNFQGLGWDLQGLQQGGYGFITLIHELGHGLGLAHPHDAGGGSPLFPGVASASDLGSFGLNQGIWTTMSYNDGWVSENDNLIFDGITDYGFQGTPMAFDIAAIQALYGANMSYKTGNDVYVLPASNGIGTFYAAIWDAGGVDTIAADTATADALIDLNDAPLMGPNAGGYVSAVANIYGGYTIANGVVIENAIGGGGNDLLLGNEFNNQLDGLSGNDSLYGDSGNDMLLGDVGDDYLYGETDSDVLVGGSGSDVLNGYGGTSAEVDTLSGDYSNSEPSLGDIADGADIFVLGDAFEAYYLGDGYATITDFYWAEGDKIQVHGQLADYSLGRQFVSGDDAIDTVIYYQDDLIGVVEDNTNVFPSADFIFV